MVWKKNNGGSVTDLHRINLNGNLGYSITVNRTESGVLDGTTLYFHVGKYLYSFEIGYNNEFIDSVTKNAGITSALNVISSFTVEPNYTNNHNDKFPCPANYDNKKYTWRETSSSREDIKNFADKGYDFLDLTIKIAGVGYNDVFVIY